METVHSDMLFFKFAEPGSTKYFSFRSIHKHIFYTNVGLIRLRYFCTAFYFLVVQLFKFLKRSVGLQYFILHIRLFHLTAECLFLRHFKLSRVSNTITNAISHSCFYS